MPRYFFDISDDVYIRDEDGSEAFDVPTIRRKAIEVANDAMKAEAAIGGKPAAIKVRVRDIANRRVLTVSPAHADRRT